MREWATHPPLPPLPRATVESLRYGHLFSEVQMREYASAEHLPARTLEQVDAHHAKLMAALDKKDAEITRLTAAALESAQTAANQFNKGETKPGAMPVTDAEVTRAVEAMMCFDTPMSRFDMRRALEGFLASRGQA